MKKVISLMFISLMFGTTLSGCITFREPKIDAEMPPKVIPSETFEYFTRPFTTIGLFGGPEETMITPEGFVRTDFGTLCFVNNKGTLIDQKVKALKDGWMPIVEYTNGSDDVEYHFSAFATTIPSVKKIDYTWETEIHSTVGWIPIESHTVPIDNMINIIRMEVINNGSERKMCRLSAYVDFTKNLGGGAAPTGVYFDKNTGALRNETSLFLVVDTSDSTVRIEEGNFIKIVFEKDLEGRQSYFVLFKYPYWVGSMDDIKPLKDLDAGALEKETVNFWEDLMNKHLTVFIPEEKPLNTFRAQLRYILTDSLNILPDEEGNKWYVVHANAFQYDHFWVRDGVKIIRALEYTGFQDIAEECLRYLYTKYQQEDGSFMSQMGQLDGTGQGLWGLGMHYEFTKSRRWAEEAFVPASKAVNWLKQQRQINDGLIQPTTVIDNEQVIGRYLGHNLYALIGLKSVIPMARAAGKEDIAADWEREYEDYYDDFMRHLDALTAGTNGLITPTFEGFDALCPLYGAYGKNVGIDWGNLKTVYPTRILNPFDWRVNLSLTVWRSMYREGLFTYPLHMDFSSIHDYNTQWITGTSLLRGEEMDVLHDLYYGFLLHTTATNAGCEGIDTLIRDFSYTTNDAPESIPEPLREYVSTMTRSINPLGNLAPHCQYAARLIWLMREMLVREEEHSLHIGSVLSPEWLKPDTRIKFSGPTTFGWTNVRWKNIRDGFEMELTAPDAPELENIVLHVPSWFEVKEILVDGKIWEKTHKIEIPRDAKNVVVRYEEKEKIDISFNKAVKDFEENRKQFDEALKNKRMQTVPKLDGIIIPDGDLSDWKKYAVFSDFFMLDEKGSRPAHGTTSWITYDALAIYVAFICEDSTPFGSGFPLYWANDYVSILIDDDQDKMIFHRVSVSRDNVVDVQQIYRPWHGWGGMFIFPEGELSSIIISAVKASRDGYIVEIMIPFSALRLKSGEWKFNLARNDASLLKPFNFQAWQFTGYNMLAAEEFGSIKFG